MPEVSSNQKRVNWKTVLIAVVIGAMLVGLGVAIYLLLQPKPTPTTQVTTKQSTPSAKISTPSAEKGETADWKKYTGETNDIEFSLKYPPSFFVTGFQWTSSPAPDPEAAGFDNVKGQLPGSTGGLVSGEIRLAIKAHFEEEFEVFGGRVGVVQKLTKPTTSSTFAGLKALKYSGFTTDYKGDPVYGIVIYYVNNQTPVDKNHHFVFECMFYPHTNTALRKTCETIASTFKFID